MSSSLSTTVPACQKAFWQAITIGDLETVKCLLKNREIDINLYDTEGEQRKGGTAIQLAILEMPTWKGSEGRNGIQTEEFVRKFIQCLLDHGADIEMQCKYRGEWYLQTAAGKTKSFFPEGYDSLGLVLQFIEITRGAEVIASDVTTRLELIRDMLLEYIQFQEAQRLTCNSNSIESSLSKNLGEMLKNGSYSDVELLCEGKIFKAHKVILSARSAVFDKMFSTNFMETHSNRVEIKEVQAQTLEAFLSFAYTDELKKEYVDLTTQLLEFSNMYDVPSLKLHCTQALERNIQISNAAFILQIAHDTHSYQLKQAAIKFISENINPVMNTREYDSLEGHLLRDIMKEVVQVPYSRKRSRTTVYSVSSAKRESKRNRWSLSDVSYGKRIPGVCSINQSYVNNNVPNSSMGSVMNSANSGSFSSSAFHQSVMDNNMMEGNLIRTTNDARLDNPNAVTTSSLTNTSAANITGSAAFSEAIGINPKIQVSTYLTSQQTQNGNVEEPGYSGESADEGDDDDDDDREDNDDNENEYDQNGIEENMNNHQVFANHAQVGAVTVTVPPASSTSTSNSLVGSSSSSSAVAVPSSLSQPTISSSSSSQVENNTSTSLATQARSPITNTPSVPRSGNLSQPPAPVSAI